MSRERETMAINHLTGKELGVRAIILAAFPDYRGRTFSWEAKERLHLSPTYWDGGTRYSYSIVQLSTGRAIGVPNQPPPQFGGPDPNGNIEMKPDFAIVEHVIFCGRDLGCRIYVHPTDAPKLIPPAVSITAEERVVLEYTRSLKSTYAGISNYRFHEAHEAGKIDSLTAWEIAKASCINKGLFNKAGAITTIGRNAIA